MILTPSPAVDCAVTRLRSLKTKHHVRRLARGMYEITSGRSGATYRVDLATMSCTCRAGQQGRVCDHKIAALSVSQGVAATIGRLAARKVLEKGLEHFKGQTEVAKAA